MSIGSRFVPKARDGVRGAVESQDKADQDRMGAKRPWARASVLAQSVFLVAALSGLLSGCRYQAPGEPPPIPPGLEPLYQPAAPVLLPPPVVSGPPRWDAADQPYYVAVLSGKDAERLLADDPAALRFLAMKQLGEGGQIAPEDNRRRRASNLGALLPLTYAQPPAADILVPLPALDDVMALLKAIESKGSPEQRLFFLDQILPLDPPQRQPLAPVDQEGCRALKNRLDKLQKTGLISPGEKEAEEKAVDRLVESGVLPEKYQPPPPPAPPPPKKKASSGSGARMPGGVSGKLEVIPSPPGVTAPKLSGKESGPVGLHLLSMGSASHGDKAWESLKTQHPELGALGFKVVKADLGDLGVTYRLIAGPVEKEAAAKICTTLKERGQSCSSTPFP